MNSNISQNNHMKWNVQLLNCCVIAYVALEQKRLETPGTDNQRQVNENVSVESYKNNCFPFADDFMLAVSSE